MSHAYQGMRVHEGSQSVQQASWLSYTLMTTISVEQIELFIFLYKFNEAFFKKFVAFEPCCLDILSSIVKLFLV